MHLIRKLFSSLHVVVLPLKFKTENCLATLSEIGQIFPYIQWIPVPSRDSILFSTSWGVLQQLKPPLFLFFPMAVQKFKFVDKLFSQGVCTQPVRP